MRVTEARKKRGGGEKRRKTKKVEAPKEAEKTKKPKQVTAFSVFPLPINLYAAGWVAGLSDDGGHVFQRARVCRQCAHSSKWVAAVVEGVVVSTSPQIPLPPTPYLPRFGPLLGSVVLWICGLVGRLTA